MTFQDFIIKYNGKFVEAGGSANALNQCVDLANQYISEVLRLPKILWTNAKDFPARAGDNYIWIKNTPRAVPQNGDMIIWDFGNPWGHIGIYIVGDANTFRSFDQNYPVGTNSHIQTHNYNNVTGWLRPKGNKMTPEERAKLDLVITDFYYAIKNEIRPQFTAINNYNAEVKRSLEDIKKAIEAIKNDKPVPDIHSPEDIEALSLIKRIIAWFKNK